MSRKFIYWFIIKNCVIIIYNLYIGCIILYYLNILYYNPKTFTEFIPNYQNNIKIHDTKNNNENNVIETKNINTFDIRNENNKIEQNEERIETSNRELLKENMDDKIISVNFISVGFQDIKNYSIPCKITDTFTKLEEKLLKDFPKLKEYEIYFEINEHRIKRHKTLKENNIKENSVISVFIFDNNN